MAPTGFTPLRWPISTTRLAKANLVFQFTWHRAISPHPDFHEQRHVQLDPPFHFPLYEFLYALAFPARRFQTPSRAAMAALLRCARTAPICFGRGGRIAATTGAARSTGAGSAILRVPKYPLVEFPKR